MPKGKDTKSANRTQNPNKRLAQYKDLIERGLKKYKGEEQKFVTNLAQFMLAEVRNERQAMQEMIDRMETMFIEFDTND